MDRTNKEQVIEQLQGMSSRARLLLLLDYRGLTVAEMNRLRQALRQAGECDLMVAKNTLARRAMAGTSLEVAFDQMTGPNAFLFAYADPVAPTKAVVEALKTMPKLDVKMGVLTGKLLTADQVKELAKLPSREETLGMLAGVLAAPARNFACVLAAIPRSLVNVLSAVKREKENEAA